MTSFRQRGANGVAPLLFALAPFFAEPSHRAIEMMQAEIVRAFDPIIQPPAVGRAIRAARKQAVQNGEENRALQREAVLAGAGEIFDRGATAGLLPQAFECQRRPDPSRRARRRLPGADGLDQHGLFGEAGARSQQSLQLPALAENVEAAERGDHLLAHRSAFAPALDDLEVGAAAGGFLAEVHGGGSRGDSLVVRTKSAL
jgi:hypothetical protein